MNAPFQHRQPDHREAIAEALWRIRVTAELAERYVQLDDHIGLARSLRHIELYTSAAAADFDALSRQEVRRKHGGAPCEQSV